MLKKDFLKQKLKTGMLYRRSDLEDFSTSIDRHLAELISEGVLKKVGGGLYLKPEKSKWGVLPPDEKKLIQAFLKDDRFLLFSFNSYNSLGLGLTQLYNHTIVYNHKRHDTFELGNRKFEFQIKPHFPQKMTKENLLIDMLNNLSLLADDQENILKNLKSKKSFFRKAKLQEAAKLYGKVHTKKIIKELLYDKIISTPRQAV